ncbi:WG repeat-containing protein [Telmatobacter bradus]|uniref:WG repeat-containing protein n=1 Tax=Telmatobacter bradus TaxID=474953 RepID=UPI003B439F60
MLSCARSFWFCTILLLVLSFSTYTAQAQKQVREITIHSGWGGLETPQNATVTIHREQRGFQCDGKPVDAKLVQTVVTALGAPQITKPELANLGITHVWLKKQLTAVEAEMPGSIPDATARQKDLFESTFADPQRMADITASLFKYWKSDDYPYVQIEVHFIDGSKLTAESNSYYAFMIPWKVQGAQSLKTYNAAISRAVSALLPSKSPNKERLSGEGFASELAEATMNHIKEHWEMIGVEDHAGDSLASLRGVYTVERTDINSYHNAEYGVSWDSNAPHEENMHATLHKASFPLNLAVEAILLSEAGKIQGIDQFLQTGSRYEKMVLSIPWLMTWLRTHPKAHAFLFYVHGKSFSDQAMRSFTQDMKVRGREELIEKVRSQQADIALIKIDGADWLIFPDKHLMLWRYSLPSGLLKWTDKDFPAGRCGAYPENDGGCSGSEVRPDGTLVPNGRPRDEACVAAYRAQYPLPALLPDALFNVMDHGRGGFIDLEGKIVIPLCFDTVSKFSDGLARFERDGKWGYLNSTGAVVIQPQFPWAEDFREGMARVQVTGSALGYDGRWGFVDKTGKVAIAPIYKRMMTDDGDDAAFHDGLVKIEVDSKSGFPLTGYIDKTGKVIIPAHFTFAEPFSDGIAAVTESDAGNTVWGYIDHTGKWAIPPQFDWANGFSDGLAAVNRYQNCGFIDRSGKYVLRPEVPAGENDCARVWGDFSEGLGRWRFGALFGYIDHTGKTVIEPRFQVASSFSEGLAAVVIGGKWGYIDTTGKMVIEPRELNRAEAFHNGLAQVVTKDGKWGYLNKTGKYVWEPVRQGSD